MQWSTVNFGKHKDKKLTLPQIVFKDLDWFFYVYEPGGFNNKGNLKDEANFIAKRITRIKIPNDNNNKLVVQYFMNSKGEFDNFEVIDSNQVNHIGTSKIKRLQYIDLSFAYRSKNYDKVGNRNILGDFKKCYFEDSSYKMTKKRCEEFFNDESNFMSN